MISRSFRCGQEERDNVAREGGQNLEKQRLISYIVPPQAWGTNARTSLKTALSGSTKGSLHSLSIMNFLLMGTRYLQRILAECEYAK